MARWYRESNGATSTVTVIVATIFILLGLLSIAEPVIAGLAATVVVGWLFLFAGGAHAVGAFRGGGFAYVIWQVWMAIIYVIGGAYLLARPFMGLGTLTLVLAAILVMEALLKVVGYVEAGEASGAIWLLLNALCTVIVAGLILFHWPSSSAWAIGTLVGVNFLMDGVSRLMHGAGSDIFRPAGQPS